jgi:hypothetical protein
VAEPEATDQHPPGASGDPAQLALAVGLGAVHRERAVDHQLLDRVSPGTSPSQHDLAAGRDRPTEGDELVHPAILPRPTTGLLRQQGRF